MIKKIYHLKKDDALFEELVVENNPYPSPLIDVDFLLKAKEVIIDPFLKHRYALLYPDPSIIGVLRRSSCGKEGEGTSYRQEEKRKAIEEIIKDPRQLPRIFQELHSYCQEICSIPEKDVSLRVERAVKKVGSAQAQLMKEEKLAIYRVLREPYNFLDDLEKLFNRSMELGKDVLTELGVKARISPVVTVFTLEKKEEELTPNKYYALLFFTNHFWYGKEPQSSALASIILSKFHKPEFYTEELLKVAPKLAERIEKVVENSQHLWEEKLYLTSVGVAELSPFETYLLSTSKLANSKETRKQLRKVISELQKKKWGAGKKLLEEAAQELKKKGRAGGHP